jgi:hypothetical protein
VSLIKNIQDKPEKERKMILWGVLGTLGLLFVILWLGISLKSFNELNDFNTQEAINFPQEEDSLPKIENTEEDMSEETIKELEELLRQIKDEQ